MIRFLSYLGFSFMLLLTTAFFGQTLSDVELCDPSFSHPLEKKFSIVISNRAAACEPTEYGLGVTWEDV